MFSHKHNFSRVKRQVNLFLTQNVKLVAWGVKFVAWVSLRRGSEARFTPSKTSKWTL